MAFRSLLVDAVVMMDDSARTRAGGIVSGELMLHGNVSCLDAGCDQREIGVLKISLPGQSTIFSTLILASRSDKADVCDCRISVHS